jgi:hypothetical protein
VADYGVNIAVAVKNTQAITKLSRDTDLLGQKIKNVNDALEKFGDLNGRTVVNSVAKFNKELAKAAENFNNVRLGSDRAADAARNFARAQDLANESLREQAALLAEVRNQGRSGTLRGGTQYGGPIGPGPASATALRSPLPPSVPVALRSPMRPQSLLPQMGMTAQAGQIASDMEEVYASILRLTEKANQEEAQKLQTLRQGTQEVEALAQKYRTVTNTNKTQKQLQLEIRRGIIETKQEAAKKAEIASQEFLQRLKTLEVVGKERREQMIAANERERILSRELDFERRLTEVRERRERRRRATGSALIGGAFPLLFGQGVGAAAGGAAGGFGGGMIGGEFGFGLSLVGTTIGSFFDQLGQKAVDLGKALRPLTADTEAVLAAVGKSDTKLASLVEELEAAGESTRALELAARELERVVGADGVEALELFSSRMIDLQNTFTSFITFVSARLAQAINDLTGETPFVRQVRDRNKAVSLARDSKDPEIVAAVKALDEMDGFGVDPKDRIAQQERIVELLNKGTEAERNRLRLNELAQKQGKDQARIVRASTAVTALQVQLLESGVHASSEQGAVIRRRIADLQEEEAITKAYKDFATDAISKDTLRARLADARVKRERTYAQILKDVNDRTAQLAEKEDRDAQRRQKAIDRRVRAVEREIKRTDTAFDRTSNKLEDITRKHEDKMAFEREYSRLIQEGSTPAAAEQAIELQKQLLELDRSYERHIEILDAQIATTDAAIAEAIARDGVTQALQDQIDKLDELKKKREGLPGEKDTAEGAIRDALKPKTGSDSITAEIDRIQGALNDLTNPAKQVIAAAQAIGDAFAESFKGLITGSMSAQEALANLFQRTADHFADMAAQMIAKQIQMKILGIALSFFNPGASQGGSFAGVPNSTLDSVLPSTSSLADAAAATPLSFASGGYASGPTRALVGEGGQGEYVIPESKMRESMARYSRGARGASVIPDAGGSGTSGEGGGVAVAAPIDVRYSIERINNIDYVTNDQFQQGLQQAAAQGAQRGEQNTLKRLQMSGSTRRRLGM